LILILILLFHGEIFKKSYVVNQNGVVLITGASTGIGREAAILFARKGFITFAGVRKQSDADFIQKEHKNIIPIILDITKESDRKNARKMIEDYTRKEKLHFVGLINNAGIGISLPSEFTPIEETRYIFEVNYFGPVGMTQELLPMIRESKGRIINVGSLAGEISIPFMGSYTSSKFALGVFTDALRRELRPWNIYVGVIEPSYVKTAMGDKEKLALADFAKKYPKEASTYYGEYFSQEKILARIKESDDYADWTSVEVGQKILDMFLEIRPNNRYLVGYGSSRLQILLHLSDSLVDFVLEKAIWNK